jgi:anti-sigma regulatory factor (Ser/Thr protein kinase)
MGKPRQLKLHDLMLTPPPIEGVHILDIDNREIAVTTWPSVTGYPWEHQPAEGWIVLCDELPVRQELGLHCDSTHFVIGDPEFLWQPLIQTLFRAGDDDCHSLAMTIPNRVESIEDLLVPVRRFLHEFLSPEPDETQTFEVLLVLRELTTNAILHGNKNSFDKKTGILLTYFPIEKKRRLQMTVIDEGQGYDLPGALRRIRSEGELRERHRGLLILKTFCQSIRVESGCVTVDYPMLAKGDRSQREE